MMEWKEVKVSDYCTAQNGYAFKSNDFVSDGDCNVIKIKELKDGKIIFTDDTAKVVYANRYDRFRVLKNDVLFALTGDPSHKPNPLSWVGRVSKYYYEEASLLNQRVCKIIFSKDIDSDFFYYYFRQDSAFRELAGKAKGSASQANISTNDILDTIITIPSLEDQRRIASILSSLDSKIETNNKINAKLEEMAQALFKSWFVDFEPFKDKGMVESELGMIPEGWRVEKLGDVCDCVLGGTPSRNHDEYWNGDIAWINSGEVNKFRIIEASEYITEIGLAKSATKLLPKKTTVLAITGATLGQVSLLEIDTCANQSVIGVKESEQIKYGFIYPLISYKIKELITHQTGGAQQHINKQNVESLTFVLPTMNVLDEYYKKINPLLSEIANLCFQNLRLSLLRDTLLPKLMSGEIEL